MDERVVAPRDVRARAWALPRIRTVPVGGRPLAYAIPALLALIAAQTWFRPGTVIAGGDLPPPIAPGSDYRAAWNQFADGVGAPSFDIVALPYYEALRAAAWLGLDGEVFQRLWLSSLYAGAAVAIVFFAFGFLESPLAAGTAGLLAVFNADRLIAPADSVPLAATVVAGVLGGLVLRAGLRRERTSAAVFALASMSLGFVFANPPHLVLVFVWLAFAVLVVAARGGLDALERLGRFALVALPAAVVVNLWWIVPAALALGGPGFKDRFAAVGVEAWSWTHRRASVANAVGLNTSWAWTHPEYFPYAHRLDQAPLTYLRFVPACLAAVGLVLVSRRDRRVALAFVALAVPVLFLAKGLNPPFAGLSRWLYTYLPGLWLFRDPAKAVLLLSLLFALLAGVAVARLFEPGGRVHPRLGPVAAVLALGAALAYVHPLFTGEVIPDRRPVLPPMHVRVPAAWTSVGAFLNAQRAPGKVLVLPRPDFYQQPARWGYYGVSFSRFVVHRGVLESAPGSYFRSPLAVSELTDAIQADLLHERASAVRPALRALGVRWVLLRRDLVQGFAGRTIPSAAALQRGLAHVPGLRRVRSFGRLDLYTLAGVREVSALTPVAYLGAADGIPPALAALPVSRAGLVPASGARRLLGGTGERRFFRIEQSRVWRLRAVSTGTRTSVVLDDPSRWRIDSRLLPQPAPRRLAAERLSPPFLVTVGAAAFLVARPHGGDVPLGLVRTRLETVVRLWRRAGRQQIAPAGVGPVRDCYSYDRRAPGKVGIASTVVGPSRLRALQLAARDHSACVAVPIAGFRPARRYRLRLAYRRISGSPPRLCLWQDGRNRCAAVPALVSSRRWHRLDTVVTPPAGVSGLRLYLYADGTGAGETAAQYRQISIEQFAPVARALLPGGPEPVGRIALPSGTPSLSVARPASASTLDLRSRSAVGDCDRYDGRTLAQVGISAVVVRGDGAPAMRLAARDHAACVNFRLGLLNGHTRYRVTLDYRRVSGNPPRVCVWQEGPNGCAPLPRLQSGAGWYRLDAAVQLERGTTGLRLFLYADGGGGLDTVSDYRRLRLQPSAPLALVGVPPVRPLPALRSERLGPSSVRVHVRGARSPFLLKLTDAYASGWRIERAGHDSRTAPHLTVDGYANGWLVPWRGTYDLMLVYEPERYASAGGWISAIVACLLLALLVASRAAPLWRRVRPA